MLSTTVSKRGGGATSLARMSARLYREQGYCVTYISGAADDGSLSEYGIDVVSLGADTLLSRGRGHAIISGMYSEQTVDVVNGWIEANDNAHTAYHLHNWAQMLSPSIFRALRSVENRTVMTCHDLFNVCPNGGMVNYPKGVPCDVQPMSSACWLSRCDKRNSAHKYWRMLRQVRLQKEANFSESHITFVCLQKEMEDKFRRLGFCPPHLTHITNPAVAFTEQRVPAESNSTFLFVGRITQEKGADLVAKAASSAGLKLVLIWRRRTRTTRFQNPIQTSSSQAFVTVKKSNTMPAKLGLLCSRVDGPNHMAWW